jgi:hypothetical protein
MTSRVILVLALAAIMGAVTAPAAWTWSQPYVQNATWGPGSSQISATNSITFNYVSFSHPWGGLPQMGTTLCTTSSSCYEWHWSNNGLITDERDIAYGYAACKANIGNKYLVYVNYCATGNG